MSNSCISFLPRKSGINAFVILHHHHHHDQVINIRIFHSHLCPVLLISEVGGEEDRRGQSECLLVGFCLLWTVISPCKLFLFLIYSGWFLLFARPVTTFITKIWHFNVSQTWALRVPKSQSVCWRSCQEFLWGPEKPWLHQSLSQSNNLAIWTFLFTQTRLTDWLADGSGLFIGRLHKEERAFSGGLPSLSRCRLELSWFAWKY